MYFESDIIAIYTYRDVMGMDMVYQLKFFFFLNLNKLDRISTFKLQSLLYDDAFLFFSFLNGYDDDSYH